MTRRTLKDKMGGMIGPMTAIAKAMSRNMNVEIIPSGFDCCTDGKVIKYPFNADYLQEASRKVLHGILDHEVAHVAEERDHAEAGIERPMSVMRRQTSKRHAMFLNVFEDIRIESKKSAEYPGMAENLAAANKHSVGLFEKRHGSSDMARANFWHTIGSAIILKARGESIEWLPASFAPFLKTVSDEIVASNFPTSRWVQDSERLAHEAIRKIEALAEELKEEQEQREQEKQEQGEDGDDDDAQSSAGGESDDEADDEADDTAPSLGDEDEDGESDAGGESDDDEDGDTQDGAGEGDTKVESTEEQGDGESGGEQAENGPESMTDSELDDAAEQAQKALSQDADAIDLLDGAKEQLMGDAREEAETSGRYIPDPKAVAGDRETRPAGDINDYNECMARVKKQIGTLRTKLLAVIRTRSAASWVGDREEGELDDSELYSVRSGNRRVFMEEIKGEKLDTAISVLVDLSGSMGCGKSPGQKAWYAKHMTIALAETFQALNVPFEVIGFHNDRSVGGGGYGRHGRDCAYSRSESFEFRMFKSFNESLRKTRARFSEITGGANNVDGEAVLFIAKRLALRPEQRKILFVLSDGCPAAAGDYHMMQKHLNEVIRMVTKAGIEVLGIGAQSPDIKRYYNAKNGADHVIINDLDSLAVEVFKLMRTRLLGRRAA